MIDEQQAWTAFEARDRRYDGRFVVGVISTRIYCRPSCPARRPRREHVRFFILVEEAVAAGLRACKRCLPDAVARDEMAVRTARQVIKQAEGPVGLAALAAATGYSPSHLQRIFTRATGLSPAAMGRALRLERAQGHLREGASVTEAIYEAGYSAPSRFYADAERLGMTPSAWRDGGMGETIRWTVARGSFGDMLVAATARGICRLTFDEDEQALRRRFPKAVLIHDPQAPLIVAALAAVSNPRLTHDLPLDVIGTAFQQRVWAELSRIPPGETRSYLDIARALGDPNATRAVGTANGANPVAVLVPCHRVVRHDGSLGGYAGGLDRKRALLVAEAGSQKDVLPLL